MAGTVCWGRACREVVSPWSCSPYDFWDRLCVVFGCGCVCVCVCVCVYSIADVEYVQLEVLFCCFFCIFVIFSSFLSFFCNFCHFFVIFCPSWNLINIFHKVMLFLLILHLNTYKMVYHMTLNSKK